MDLELTLMFHRCSTSVGLIRVGPNHNYMIVTHLATVLKEKFIIGFAECRRSLVRLLVSALLSAKQSTDIAPRSSGEEDSRSLKPFRWNPAGNQSRPVEPDQQPEASLAWRVGDHPCEA